MTDPAPRFEGKVVLITGTAGGQGRAAALRFAAEGATVFGCDLDAERAAETVDMVRAQGGEMTSEQPLDVADPDAVKRWIDAVEAVGQRGIDVLYNNASTPRFASVIDMTDEDWRFTVRNELDLVFYACRAAWPHLAANGGGAIINIASIQGICSIRSAAGGFAHAATKHGIIGFTRELANEGGPLGIRVNAISPGLISSPATQGLIAAPGIIDAFMDHQIIRRLGEPDDIAAAALFLASDDASFITGENLVVDGGYSVV